MGINHSSTSSNTKPKSTKRKRYHRSLFNRFFIGSKHFFSPNSLNTCLFNDDYALKSKRNPSQSVQLQISLPESNQSIVTHPIQCTIAIRKDSLKLIRSSDEFYSIDFIFDADRPVQISLHLMAHEQYNNNNGSLSYISCQKSDTIPRAFVFNCSPGYGQMFSSVQNDVHFPLSIFTELHQDCTIKTRIYPIVIVCREMNTDGVNTTITPTFDQFHIILATIRSIQSDGSMSINVVNQKHVYHGIIFQLFEFYGIENLRDNSKKSSRRDHQQSICVICLSDLRRVLLLPCRHFCLCHSCAENLKFQSANCPICRIPFRALLQMNVLHDRRDICIDEDEDEKNLSLIDAFNSTTMI